MADWNRLVAGAFAYEKAPFGVHPNDRKRAATYLAEAIAAGLSWSKVEAQVRGYMVGKGFTDEAIDENLDQAAKLLRPWLD